MFAPQAARPSHQLGVAFAPRVARATPGAKPRRSVARNIMKTPPACAGGQSFFGITEIEGGFPHSEIRGSKVVRTSPRLIAAYHVLHRLSAPRHPPNTLKALDRSHYRCPSPRQRRMTFIMLGIDRKTICFEHIREHRGQADAHNWQLVVSNAYEVQFPARDAGNQTSAR